MDIRNLSWSADEGIAFALRGLYEKYGYSHYRMSKFEEYDLYARNKDFLISDSVITFTDMDGRLLALKPDVTLSIVKNLNDKDNFVKKLYYNENVYRVSKGNRSFKEIMQTGLEAFGNIDTYTLCEVITLAAESLAAISNDWVLDVSNLDILSAVLEKLSLDAKLRDELWRLTAEKNTHEITTLLKSSGIAQAELELVTKLVSTSGAANEVLAEIKPLLSGFCDTSAVEALEAALSAMDERFKERIRIDFSVVDNTKYYNGIVFKGFIKGVPTAVLSGGQYSRLMKRMGRSCDAVGFAVYHDTLERLYKNNDALDVDALLVYGNSGVLEIKAATQKLQAEGLSVLAEKEMCDDIKFGRLFILEGGELKEKNCNA